MKITDILHDLAVLIIVMQYQLKLRNLDKASMNYKNELRNFFY